jgi:murein hydrolase activator
MGAFEKIYLILFAIMCIGIGYAQKSNLKNSLKNKGREELEQQRASILNEIKETQAKLSSLQKDKNASMQQLQILQDKLVARQALINNINKEINLLENSITEAEQNATELKTSLSDLKKRYAELVRYTYKNRASQSVLMFLFSSKNFNEAMRKYNYVKQYRNFRKLQAQQITNTSTELNQTINSLEEQKNAKDNILLVQLEQQKVIAAESEQKNQVVLGLKGQEKVLLANIAEKKKTADLVNRAINAAIKREIEIARKKAEEERRKVAAAKAEQDRMVKEKAKAEAAAKKRAADELARQEKLEAAQAKAMKKAANSKTKTINNGKASTTDAGLAGNNNPKVSANNNVTKREIPKPTPTPPPPPKPTTSYTDDLSSEARANSNSFEASKGVLSAPAAGYICSHFGKNKHPVFNVYEQNYGIDIRTAKGANAKAVFAGEVSSVFFIAGAGNHVLINHGTYFTLYSKLDKVNITKGSKVSAGTILGTVMTDADGNNQVHFEVWKVGANGSTTQLNPEQWIR